MDSARREPSLLSSRNGRHLTAMHSTRFTPGKTDSRVTWKMEVGREGNSMGKLGRKSRSLLYTSHIQKKKKPFWVHFRFKPERQSIYITNHVRKGTHAHIVQKRPLNGCKPCKRTHVRVRRWWGMSNFFRILRTPMDYKHLGRFSWRCVWESQWARRPWKGQDEFGAF